jgi:hypothetical protein
MNPLYEIHDGAIGTIHYLIKTSVEVTEEERERIRNKMMADYVHGAIMSASYEPSKAMDIQTAMQRGANEANKAIERQEDGTEMKTTLVLVGDPNTPDEISKIEETPGFRGWVNPVVIRQIKDFYNK